MPLITPLSAPELPAASPLHEGRFSGPLEFNTCIRRAMAAAARENWTDIIICDIDFFDWPLGEKAPIEALTDWVRAGRQFTMLAERYDEVWRRHPRFVTWRQTWGHRVTCLARRNQMGQIALPSAFWTPSWALQRLDRAQCVGVATLDPMRRVALREELREVVRQSSPAFAATTLGL